MAYIGIKVTETIRKALDKASDDTGRTKSDLIREAVEHYLMDYFTTDEESDWKITAWKFLGLDSHRIHHAMTRSENASEFFSFVARWVKPYELRLHPSSTHVTVGLITNTDEIQFSVEKSLPKEKIVARIIEGLEKEATDKMLEDI